MDVPVTQTIIAQALQHRGQAREMAGLDQESIRAQRVGKCHLAGGFRAGKNGNGSTPCFPILPQPLENVKAADFGHFQVQQDQSRQRKHQAIIVGPFTFQIRDCLLAITNEMHPGIDPSHGAGKVQKHFVVLVVIDTENLEGRNPACLPFHLYSIAAC